MNRYEVEGKTIQAPTPTDAAWLQCATRLGRSVLAQRAKPGGEARRPRIEEFFSTDVGGVAFRFRVRPGGKGVGSLAQLREFVKLLEAVASVTDEPMCESQNDALFFDCLRKLAARYLDAELTSTAN